jgi:predicted transcriptional regulator
MTTHNTIQELITAAWKHQVPFSVILGRLESGTKAEFSLGWEVTEFKSAWRPRGVTHAVLGRLVPTAPLPVFDELEVASALEAPKKSTRNTFKDYQEHRICLRVPQRGPVETFDQKRYNETDLAVAEGAVKAFGRLTAEQRVVRVFAIPSAFKVLGGFVGKNEIPMTTQHHPLMIEDANTGEVLWKHPEAGDLVEGKRLGGTAPALLPPPPPTEPTVPPPAATTERTIAKPVAAQVALPAPQQQVEPWFQALLESAKLLNPNPSPSDLRAILVSLRCQSIKDSFQGLAASPDPTALAQLASKDVDNQLAKLSPPPPSPAAPPQAAGDTASGHQKTDPKPLQASFTPRTVPVTVPALERLKKCFEDRLILQPEIARLLGRTQPNVSRLLSGNRGTSRLTPKIVQQIEAIVTALEQNQPLPEPLPKEERKTSQEEGSPRRHRRKASAAGEAGEPPKPAGHILAEEEV